MKEIEEYLTKLGLTREEVTLYCALITKGPLTILEASRASQIERTRLYRLVEQLTERGILEEVLEQKSRRIKAVEPEKIKALVTQEVDKTRELEQNFSTFAASVASLTQIPSTQVRYFRGVSGIKQILWNETKGNGEVIGYTYRNLEEVVGKPYFEKYAQELEKNHVVSRDLRGDSFLESMDRPDFVRRHIDKSEWRYLPDSVMHVTHNLDVYNDVLAIYYWEDNDVFGVEIQNRRIADMQRSIFETLWKLSENYELPEKYRQFKRTKKA